MKTYQKPSTSKLVNRFDKELMNILMNDLKKLKTASRLAVQLIKQNLIHTQLSTIKAQYKPAKSKLVTRFDNELKNLLMEDLKAFIKRNQFTLSNKQKVAQQQLIAA